MPKNKLAFTLFSLIFVTIPAQSMMRRVAPLASRKVGIYLRYGWFPTTMNKSLGPDSKSPDHNDEYVKRWENCNRQMGREVKGDEAVVSVVIGNPNRTGKDWIEEKDWIEGREELRIKKGTLEQKIPVQEIRKGVFPFYINGELFEATVDPEQFKEIPGRSLVEWPKYFESFFPTRFPTRK